MKTDSRLKKDIEQELEWDPSIDAAGIGVEVRNGIVTLAGHLRSYVEKLSARKAAQLVEGVKGVVVELDVRIPSSSRRTDEDIATSARSVLAWNAGLDEHAVKVTVEKGCVTLTGEVDWEYQARSAEKAVTPLRGVVVVVNQIQIKHQPVPTDIPARIEAALKRHAEDESRRVRVDVDDGTVTLHGTVSSLAEKSLALHAVWSAPGVRHVLDELTVARR
ncbi:BON domain-containing protein [Trinickia dinghuensis]|uniref:BON domain-containing protein n=1 Tax=Trinickia dinghuensis TaxID=2291023 RepID=A0A3D8K372_9BURK|nr:BON domain-containing protein [Trinickia dinghuensis]RDU99346.1 BON domain-containing protein [Trinickia dinghuensis]